MGRQRGEIRQLQRAGIPTIFAEALLERMLNKIDALCAERGKLKRELPPPRNGKAMDGRHRRNRGDHREGYRGVSR
jgi:hypothetical protein